MSSTNQNLTLNSLKDLGTVKEELEKSAQQSEAKRQQRFDEAKKIIERLEKSYPIVFNPKRPQPLAIGIEKEIHKLHPEFTVSALRFALALWTKRERYLVAIVSTQHRHNLDESVAGIIEDSEREYSRMMLEKKRQKKQAHSQKRYSPSTCNKSPA